MALYKFSAEAGVQLGSEPVWAHFTRDEAYDSPEGVKGYSFITEDAAVAGRLRKIKDYGIREVK